jgi:hypothetical protein
MTSSPVHTDLHYGRYAYGWTTARTSLVDDSFGGNFCDLTLRVKICGAAQTFTVFRPEFWHGTTWQHGLETRGVGVTFSKRNLDAFQASQAGENTQNAGSFEVIQCSGHEDDH